MKTSGGVLGKDASDSVYATVHQVCQRVGMREWKDEGPFKVLDLVVTEMFFNEPARENRNVPHQINQTCCDLNVRIP